MVASLLTMGISPEMMVMEFPGDCPARNKKSLAVSAVVSLCSPDILTTGSAVVTTSASFRDTDLDFTRNSCMVPDIRTSSLISSSSLDFKNTVLAQLERMTFSTSSE